MSQPRKSNIRGWLLRAAGSAVLLGLLAWLLPLDAVLDGFARVSLGQFVLVWAVFMLGHVAAAGKWWVLLDRSLAFLDAVRAHVAGLAANLCLPGAAGGDVVRAGAAQLAMRDGAKVISGSVADRLIDMMALAILACAGGMVLAGAGGAGLGTLAVQVALFMLLALASALYVVPRLVPAIWARYPKLPAGKLVTKVASEFGVLASRPAILLGSLTVSTAIQALFVWLAMLLGQQVGVALPIAAWFFAWPLAKLLAVLPISLNGLGLREATLAGLMVPLGANGAEVVAAGLVWQAILFATGGLGALVLALSGFRLRPYENSKV
jgi:uncharacterized membrane protein YbhN (UPF0104 family)